MKEPRREHRGEQREEEPESSPTGGEGERECGEGKGKERKVKKEELRSLTGGREIEKGASEKGALGREALALAIWTRYPVSSFLCHCSSLWHKELKVDSKDTFNTAAYHSSLFPLFYNLLSFLSNLGCETKV